MPHLDLSPEDLVAGGDLARMPNRIFSAGDAVGREDSSGPEALAAVAREVAQLEAWSRTVPRLRPLVAFNGAVVSAVGHLIDVYDIVVEALGAETIPAAQSCQPRVQRALDAAAEAAAGVRDLLTTVDVVLESDDPLGSWLNLAVAGDIAKACQEGRSIYESRTGNQCAEGAAFAARAYDTMISTVGEPDRFWSLVADHAAFLEQNAAELGEVVRTVDFRSRLSQVVHDLWAAAVRAARTPEPETTRQFVAEVLEAGHLVMEQPLKFHLGIGCAVKKRRGGFSATQACDVSELINIAVQQGWPVASALGTADVRNAFAHRDFAVESETVTLSPGRRRTAAVALSVAELQDSVLQLVETCAAMELALVAVAGALQIDGWVSPEGSFLIRPLLLALGWTDVVVEERRPSEVAVSASVEAPVPLAALAFGVQPLVGSVELLSLNLSEIGGQRSATLAVPVRLFADWSSTEDSLLKEIAFVRLSTHILLDGEPLMNGEHSRKLIAFRACELVSDREREFSVIRQPLGSWRALALELDLGVLQKDIGRAMRWRASAEAGLPVDPAEMGPLLAAAAKEIKAPRSAILD